MRTLAREGDRTEILRRLKRLREDSPRRWGRMSAHQMVCHATDACRMALGQKRVSAVSVPLRTIVKWIVLYAPVRWPRGIPTRPELDQDCDGTRPRSFDADVASLEALIRELSSHTGPRRRDWPPHPLFGEMSEQEWLRWAYLHLDHHLRQFGV